MKIRLLSDVHNEFSVLNLPVMEDESEQVLVLAGDIGLTNDQFIESTIYEFVNEMVDRFKHVVYLSGNHDAYHGRYDEIEARIMAEFEDCEKFTYLQDTFVDIDGYRFVGGTLWTNMNNCDQDTMYQTGYGMNDYWIVKLADKETGVIRPLSPTDTVEFHRNTFKTIFDTVKATPRHMKVVVCTHHAPSWKSIDEARYGADSKLNGAYASRLDESIMDMQSYADIPLWVHGHVHATFDYHIGNTNVRTNPRGYSYDSDGFENPDFDSQLVLEV